jgi:hypothetical protein
MTTPAPSLPMTMDAFGTTMESLMIRGDPSSGTVKEFVDGSTTGAQVVSIYGRSKNPATILTALDTIRKKLDGKKITLTEVYFIKTVIDTLPAYVSKEDTGEFIYTMTVNVRFYGKNPITGV